MLERNDNSNFLKDVVVIYWSSLTTVVRKSNWMPVPWESVVTFAIDIVDRSNHSDTPGLIVW